MRVINRLSDPTEIQIQPASLADLSPEMLETLDESARSTWITIPSGRTDLPEGTVVLSADPNVVIKPTPPAASAPPAPSPEAEPAEGDAPAQTLAQDSASPDEAEGAATSGEVDPPRSRRRKG